MHIHTHSHTHTHHMDTHSRRLHKHPHKHTHATTNILHTQHFTSIHTHSHAFNDSFKCTCTHTDTYWWRQCRQESKCQTWPWSISYCGTPAQQRARVEKKSLNFQNKLSKLNLKGHNKRFAVIPKLYLASNNMQTSPGLWNRQTSIFVHAKRNFCNPSAIYRSTFFK